MRLPENDTERNTLTRGVVYPLGDRLTLAEREGFGLSRDWTQFQREGLKVGAFAPWEYRPIRPGEWYFSGAEIEAYRAREGTTTPYHVAHLVSYRTETTVNVVVEKRADCAVHGSVTP